MKRSLAAILAVCLGVQLAAAQSYNGHAYAFFGVDALPNASPGDALSVGGGGEVFLWKGLAAGGDVGYVGPRGRYDAGVGLGSVNGSYHAVNRAHPARFVPFVTAGYGVAFRSGTLNLWNIGGGATWWFSRHAGLRTEVRSFHWKGERFDTALRIGVAFK